MSLFQAVVWGELCDFCRKLQYMQDSGDEEDFLLIRCLIWSQQSKLAQSTSSFPLLGLASYTIRTITGFVGSNSCPFSIGSDPLL